jgi:hypothetical protein
MAMRPRKLKIVPKQNHPTGFLPFHLAIWAVIKPKRKEIIVA